jgi:D-serine deaminase-like pyridoxal phosphate-dependent protein
MIEYGDYRIADPDSLETPAMVVFESALDHNIAAMCERAGGAQNLMVHVKTHKSDAVTRKQIDAGVFGFKCATVKEVEMVLGAGAREVVLSYPLLQHRKIEWLCDLAEQHPGARIYPIVSTRPHADALAHVAGKRPGTLPVLVDLDLGLKRTGVSIDGAADLYRYIDRLDRLSATGIHAYDGHEHFPEAHERRAAAHRHIDDIRALVTRIETGGLRVERIVAGSSFSFEHYARAEGMLGSPGTSVYWDMGYDSTYPDSGYRHAALVLTQVIDRYPPDLRFTTDLGVKGISADQPLESRATILGHVDTRLVLQNEEHGVFTCSYELPEIGCYLLAVPGHVCTTTLRYPGSYVVDEAGQVIDYYPHVARDRR